MRSLVDIFESFLDKANKKDTTNTFNQFLPAKEGTGKYDGEDIANITKYLREVATKKGTKVEKGRDDINMWWVGTQDGAKLTAKTYGIYFNWGEMGLVYASGKNRNNGPSTPFRKGIMVGIQGTWYFTNLARTAHWTKEIYNTEDSARIKELYLIDEDTWLELFQKMGDAFGRETEVQRSWLGDKEAQKIVKKLLKL